MVTKLVPGLLLFLFVIVSFSQTPPIEPGVSHELAKWRAARYSDVRYKLNLTLEKMSPVLKGTIEIRVRVSSPHVSKGNTADTQPTTGTDEMAATGSEPGAIATGFLPPIILDWRKIAGHENDSTVKNVTVNGKAVWSTTRYEANDPDFDPDARQMGKQPEFTFSNEHLIFRDGVKMGENVIKLDFTSPILTSGSAITRYIDKEDGAEYIYSLFVPSDASTAFPVFDQPDLKARFTLSVVGIPTDWTIVSNTPEYHFFIDGANPWNDSWGFPETKPISSYVFAFAAGPFKELSDFDGTLKVSNRVGSDKILGDARIATRSIFVRKSQFEKFKPHAAEVFRLNREGIKFLETYFDYKFPFPKYDIVLIPEFPFGGMEHAGATFLRESSVIFPQEPTKNDYITRANVIFHETAHQWFGDTVTMKWFDDLWLKEGFAEFMAYKTLEKVMPQYNAWKVFYERNKQAAYLTDSTKGTTAIYQPIDNLSAAKSAYGNIVYRKAPSFLRQAEFYLGEDKFKAAVRAFLKNHAYANAGWEDLVKEFGNASGKDLKKWAETWVQRRGVPLCRVKQKDDYFSTEIILQCNSPINEGKEWPMKIKAYSLGSAIAPTDPIFSAIDTFDIPGREFKTEWTGDDGSMVRSFFFPNYQDYGYGIFLLDDKSRDYILKNIQNEKDDFLRTMMWGSLWDSVREAELDPKGYIELVLRVQSSSFSRPSVNKKPPKGGTQNAGTQNVGSKATTTPSAEAAATPPIQGGEQDESTIQTLLSRVSTAMNYYVSDAERAALAPKVEALLIDKMQNAPTPGLRITYYRAFLITASSPNARGILKQILKANAGPKGGNPSSSEGAQRGISSNSSTLPTGRVSSSMPVIRTKDRFDIVTRLMILGDPDAPRLLAELEKTETSDDAKRYAYAARAGMATAENKAKFWADYTTGKDIPESWIEASLGAFNSIRHSDLTLPYLERALAELPRLKRDRKIFFVNGWLGAFIGGQRSEAALGIINKFLADNPNLDNDLRLKILENSDLIERAVRIRAKFGTGKN